MRKIYWIFAAVSLVMVTLLLGQGCGKSDGSGVGGKVIITGGGTA